MYIHATYSFVHSNEAVNFYKHKVKEITNISMRRASKFNLLSLYGAYKCIENMEFPLRTSIYIGSQFGVVSGVTKVMHALHQEPLIVMPVDFLNINGNNAGFTISKVLNTKGANILMMGSDLTFELTLKVAFSKSRQDRDFSALIGGVDESLEMIENYQSCIIDQGLESYDGSCWLYCSNHKGGAIAKIEAIRNFKNDTALEKYLEKRNFNEISYNFLVSHEKKNDFFYGTQSAWNMNALLKSKKQHLGYVSKDREGRVMLIEIEKY